MVNKKRTVRIIGTLCAMVLIIGSLGGCANKEKSASIKTAKKFLEAAKDMDYEKAGKYATDETMENLGWNDMDTESLENVFYTSMGLEESEVEVLKEDKEVKAAVDELVEKMSSDVKDFEIKKKSFKEEGDTAKIKVTVTRISADQLGSIFEEVQGDIEEQAKEIGEELKSGESSSSDKKSDEDDDSKEESISDEETSGEDMNVEVIRRLIPSIVPSMIEKLDAAEGAQEEWVVEVDTKSNKVSGVYESK